VFRQQEKLLRMVLQQEGEERAKQVLDGVVSGVRNDGGMGFFCDWEEMKVPIRDVSASGKCSPVFFSGVSASEK
jgi:hypothetical protein